MTKRLSSAAAVALKEALCLVYWYKNDLRSFLHRAVPPTILQSINWADYKRQIASDVVDALLADQDTHLGNILRLCNEITTMTSFKHLEALEDGATKASKAQSAVAQLRALLTPHQQAKNEKEQAAIRTRTAEEKTQAKAAFRKRLEQIKRQYFDLLVSTNPQLRGFELEKVLRDLFELFDLDPKASFRNTGEQIDGAFTCENTDYLFEGKWQKDPISASDLDAFAAKIRRKLENTLGLFLAINGFSSEGIRAHASGGAVVILMDGADLVAVLEERIDFVGMLMRKKRHAAQTGNIFLPYTDFSST